jgi:RNA polymerase sporulation-specific sigma factor
MEHEDDLVVARIQRGQGDERDYRLLWDRHRTLVDRELRRYYGSGAYDLDDYRAIAMGAFYDAIRAYVEGGAPFVRFAAGCVRRRLVSACQGARRQRHRIADEAQRLEEPYGDHDDTRLEHLADPRITDPVERIYWTEMLRSFSRTLSPFERDVLEAYLVEGCYRDTARSLGRSMKAVDNALLRIRQKAHEWRRYEDDRSRKDLRPCSSP